MTSIKVLKYNSKDHEEVKRIFSEGIQEHVKTGILLGLQNPKIQIQLAFAFCYGFLYSWFYGFLYLALMLCIQMASVTFCFYGYVLEKVASDMKDKELKFWTTDPNRFLVAKTSNGKVVGCVSYKQINEDTAEMNRLAVDSNFRGMKIGRKLVEECMNEAKSEGHQVMYLDTSSAQIDACKMYEKLGYSLLRKTDFGEGYGAFIANYFSGLCVYAYIKRL